jgi:aspartyl-tRNA(Asn)/glutamyl-tRNA(Gln) amidotransferase subunit B
MHEIFNAMLDSEKSAEKLAGELNLIQVSDTGFIDEIVDQIINDNPNEAERYRAGEKKLTGFFVGQAMKASQGKANPQLVREAIMKKLES